MRVVGTMPELSMSDEVILGGPIGPAVTFMDEVPAIERAFQELAQLLAEPAPASRD